MAIEVDMAKVYDRVEWVTLKAVLLAHSFSEDMCNVVLKCISSMHYSVLTNGFLTASLQDLVASAKEILSSTLFTIVADLLSRNLAKAESEGRISGVKIARTSPHITRLMYADDWLIYYKADISETLAVKECLDQYCKWSR